MIAIITALMAEARPIIDHFHLDHHQEPNTVRVWKNHRMLVAVTGTGKIRAAACASALCTHFGDQIEAVINVGLAGAAFQSKKGEIFLVNQIVDHHSQAAYYPEMLIQTDLKEKELRTFDHTVTRRHLHDDQTGWNGLVDMEASGFFGASLMFLPATRISCLKIVSDFLENLHFSKKKASGLVKNRLDSITLYIRQVEQFIVDNKRTPLTPAVKNMIADISAKLNLTITQQRQLEKRVIYKSLISDEVLSVLSSYQGISAHDKQERNRLLEELFTQLT